MLDDYGPGDGAVSAPAIELTSKPIFLSYLLTPVSVGWLQTSFPHPFL